jgi:hypothetical protein
MNRGAIPLQQSGTMVARTAQLTAGDTGMGRALQGIGAQLADMAQKEQEADDARLMIEFEGDMRKAVDEQSVFQQQVQEQSEWLPAWQKRSTDLQKRLDGLKVSDKTRLNLTQSFGQFADRHTLNIRGQAFEQSQARAKESILNRNAQAIRDGDVDAVGQTMRLAAASNVGLPEWRDGVQADAMEKAKAVKIERANTQANTALANNDVESAMAVIEQSPMPADEKALAIARLKNGAARKKEADDLMVIANDNPDMAAELAVVKEREGKITGQDRVNIERESYQAKSFKRRDAVTKYKERLALHDIPSADELKQDASLTDFDRASIAALATGSVNDPAEFESALTAAMSFDPSKYVDPREAVTAATQMEASFEARFDGPYLDNLRSELTKRRDRDAAAPTSETDIGPAMQQLEDSIRQGGLFPLERPVMQDGKPVMQDPKKIGFVMKPGWFGESPSDVKENEGKPVPLTEPDKVAIERAAAIQREIRRTLESEVKAGKLKDQSEITARMFDLSTMKGVKVKPVKPNPLIPSLQNDGMSEESFNETLKKYGK